jgi:hypothetical protein
MAQIMHSHVTVGIGKYWSGKSALNYEPEFEVDSIADTPEFFSNSSLTPDLVF